MFDSFLGLFNFISRNHKTFTFLKIEGWKNLIAIYIPESVFSLDIVFEESSKSFIVSRVENKETIEDYYFCHDALDSLELANLISFRGDFTLFSRISKNKTFNYIDKITKGIGRISLNAWESHFSSPWEKNKAKNFLDKQEEFLTNLFLDLSNQEGGYIDLDAIYGYSDKLSSSDY